MVAAGGGGAAWGNGLALESSGTFEREKPFVKVIGKAKETPGLSNSNILGKQSQHHDTSF